MNGSKGKHYKGYPEDHSFQFLACYYPSVMLYVLFHPLKIGFKCFSDLLLTKICSVKDLSYKSLKTFLFIKMDIDA